MRIHQVHGVNGSSKVAKFSERQNFHANGLVVAARTGPQAHATQHDCLLNWLVEHRQALPGTLLAVGDILSAKVCLKKAISLI